MGKAKTRSRATPAPKQVAQNGAAGGVPDQADQGREARERAEHETADQQRLDEERAAQENANPEAAARKEAERQQATKAETGKAQAKAAAEASQRGKAKAFLQDFISDVPHEAQSQAGLYSFGVRDRWYKTKPGLLDGWYRLGDWAIRIHGGEPVTAAHSDNPLFPKTVKFDLS